jgi:hypothetical protein
MTRFSTERWAGLAGLGFVVAYVAAFAMGIEVGPTDRDILDYYADSTSRAREVVAFFLIAVAALCLVLFALGVRGVVDRAGPAVSTAARVAFAGGLAASVLILAGDALSRATAFAAMEAEFKLEPDTRRLFETAGFLLRLRCTRGDPADGRGGSCRAAPRCTAPMARLVERRHRRTAPSGHRLRRLPGLPAMGPPRERGAGLPTE